MSRKSDFKMIYSPYSRNTDEDISVLFDEYSKDKNAVVSIENKTYYRAIQIFSLIILQPLSNYTYLSLKITL